MTELNQQQLSGRDAQAQTSTDSKSKGDFAQGMRTEPAALEGADFARGERTVPPNQEGPDYARGERTLPAAPEGPDYAHGSRGRLKEGAS
jgi:hypothetical protein